MTAEELFPNSLPPFIRTRVISTALVHSGAAIRNLVKKNLLPRPIRLTKRGPLMFPTDKVRAAVAAILAEAEGAAIG